MQTKLTQMLHMTREPVGIYFANTSATCDITGCCLTTHSWRAIEKRL